MSTANAKLVFLFLSFNCGNIKSLTFIPKNIITFLVSLTLSWGLN
jgi:hypothetical protein